MNETVNINIEGFDYPILILDKNLQIIKKNVAAGEYKVRFRVGAALKNYLSSYDIKRVESLQNGGVMFITSIDKYEDFFVIYRQNDKYYLIYATMIKILNDRIEAYCNNDAFVETYFNHTFDTSLNDTETKLRKMRFNAKLKRHYAIFNELFFNNPTLPSTENDLMSAVSIAFEKMDSIMNKDKKMLLFDNRVKANLGTMFSMSDLALVLSSLVVLAFSMKEMGNVCCSADHLADNLIISVGFIGGKCDEFDHLLFSFDEATTRSRSIELFELLLLKRLCDHNGWNLKFSLFTDTTNQVFKLFIPCKETSLLNMSLDDRNYDILEKMIYDELSFLFVNGENSEYL